MRAVPALALVVILGLVLPCVAQDEPSLPETVSPTGRLIEVYSGNQFYEGPTWDPKGGKLYFAAFRRGADILRLESPATASIWQLNSGGVNGTFLSNDGRLLGAQAFGHRIVSYALGGDRPRDVKILAENPRWHQPNDLCQTASGNIYFTDPDFEQHEQSAVYLLTPDGQIRKIIDDMPSPNGIIASNDGKTLYVSDSDEILWRSYPILDDGGVGAGRVFFNPDTLDRASPDGMTIDERGNLYFTGRGGVWVVSPEGNSLGLIPLREFCTNATFGGKDGRTLFITCSKKVYSLKMRVRGAQFRD